MAGEIPPLNIQINLETSGVQAGVQATADKLKGVTATVETATSKFGGLKTVMLGTFASAALQKGLKDLEGFLKDSIHVAEEAQTSITGLATAMNNAKVNTEANRQAMEKSTQAMMNLGFTGNDARGALTKLVTSTGSVTQAQKLMGVAADYARLKHMDLATAATVLSRGTVGAARAFREYGITLDTNLPKNQAITKAFDELNQKIGGQAAAYAETYAGKMAILSSKTNELKEKIGTMLLPVLTKLSSWFIGSLEWLTKHKVAMEAVATLLAAVLIPVITNLTIGLYKQAAAWVVANAGAMAIVAIIAAVAAGFVWAWNKFENFRHAVVAGMEGIIDVVSFLLKAIGFIAEAFIQVETGPLRLFLKALGFFVPAAKTASQELDKLPKMVGDFFDGAATKVEGFKKTLESVKDKKINIELPDFAKMLATAGGGAGAAPDIAGQAHEKIAKASDKAAKAAAAAEKKRQADLVKAYKEEIKLADDYANTLLDRQDQMDKALADRQKAERAAKQNFDDTVADLNRRKNEAYASAQRTADEADSKARQTHSDALLQIEADYESKKADLLASYNDKVASLQAAAADKATQLEQGAADKRQGIIQQSIDLMTGAWENATKIDIGSLFKSTNIFGPLVTTIKDGIKTVVSGSLGGTADGLAAAMKDQLDQILKLQKDAGDLAAQGYSQAFIDQVIAKGPDVGDQMAQAVLNATPETASQIKDLYGKIEDVSNNGLTALATQMNSGAKLATQALIDQYKQVGVDLQVSLSDNQAQLTAAIAGETATYTKALASAAADNAKAIEAADKTLTDALAAEHQRLLDAKANADQAFNDGLATAQRSLEEANAASMEAWNTKIAEISKTMDDKLNALQAKIKETLALIASLNGGGGGGGYTPPAKVVPAPTNPDPSKNPNPGTTPYNAGGLTFYQTNNIDAATSPADIGAATLSMINYGMPITVTAPYASIYGSGK
jgi:hypothetical protein